MPGVLDMLTGSLEPTATYARRDWVWVPASPLAYPDGRLGSLTIVLQHSRRAGAKQESDTYGVDEEAELPAGVRSFLLASDTDPDQPDVYRCTLGRGWSDCTCRAGLTRRECKHVAGLRAVIEEGGL